MQSAQALKMKQYSKYFDMEMINKKVGFEIVAIV